jgi:hypothetical protein
MLPGRSGQEEEWGNPLLICTTVMNDIIKKDYFPLSWVYYTLDTLAGTKLFSTLDLKSGYWITNLHPDDKEKNAFLKG